MKQILTQLESYLSRGRDTRPREHHYPSTALDCIRKTYYAFKGESKTDLPKPGQVLKMQFGDAIHTKLSDLLEEAGFDIANEISFVKKIPKLKYLVKGRIDNLIVINNEIEGIEIKSSYGRGISALKGNGIKPEHLAQVIVYLNCADIKRFHLIYVGRDNAYRCEYIIEYLNNQLVETAYEGQEEQEEPILLIDKKTIEKPNWNLIVSRWVVLEQALQDNKIPVQEYQLVWDEQKAKEKYELYLAETEAKKPLSFKSWNKTHNSDWQCSYCNWKTLCWK